jgi:hypothetical protein
MNVHIYLETGHMNLTIPYLIYIHNHVLIYVNIYMNVHIYLETGHMNLTIPDLPASSALSLGGK